MRTGHGNTRFGAASAYVRFRNRRMVGSRWASPGWSRAVALARGSADWPVYDPWRRIVPDRTAIALSILGSVRGPLTPVGISDAACKILKWVAPRVPTGRRVNLTVIRQWLSDNL